MKHVAIIGGGLAGLTCAYALKRRGIDSTVFESSAEPGGRADAALYLLAPDLFRDTFALIKDLGLTGHVLPIAPHAGQFYKGRVYHHRVASATGLLAFKGLSFPDKAMLPRMAYLLARHSSSLDFHRPELGLEFDGENAASYVKRQLSQNVLNYVAGPLISTLFFYGSEETSAWLYMILAKHMYNVRMSTLQGGIGTMTTRLAEGLRILMGRPVARVAMEGDSYIVDGQIFSELAVAVPGDAVLRIAGMNALLSAEDRKFFEDCRYQRTVSVEVSTSKPVDGACYAVTIPRVEKLSASTISFHDFIDPSSVPDGEGRLTISGGGALVTADTLLADLGRIYSIEPKSTKTSEWICGMPKFPPGRYREITEFNARQRRPGLFFCGDYLSGPVIEGAVSTGMAVVRAIAA